MDKTYCKIEREHRGQPEAMGKTCGISGAPEGHLRGQLEAMMENIEYLWSPYRRLRKEHRTARSHRKERGKTFRWMGIPWEAAKTA
jgi:hypothetical protein